MILLNLRKKEIAAKTETGFKQMKVFIIFIICDLLKYICIDTWPDTCPNKPICFENLRNVILCYFYISNYKYCTTNNQAVIKR